MVVIKNSGKFCYVEGDDIYILYYLFGYRMNNNKCFFRKKHLGKVLFVLNEKEIGFKINGVRNDYVNNNYDYYLHKGKYKYELEDNISLLETKLLNLVSNRRFNKIYRKLYRCIYE